MQTDLSKLSWLLSNSMGNARNVTGLICCLALQVEDAQNIFPDAPHGISLDGSGSSQVRDGI